MKSEKGMAGYILLAWLALCAAGIVGWVMNIVKLVQMLDGSVTALFIARIVGVFAAPLGAILGFF